MKAIVTGGLGFIGSHLSSKLIQNGYHISIIDCQTYAHDKKMKQFLSKNKNVSIYNVDIRNFIQLSSVINKVEPDVLFHLAAETHVDNSIDNPDDFITTNIIGTYNILKACKFYYESTNVKNNFKIISISTDEVFGECINDEKFNEFSPYNPRSPYSASKASADHLAKSYFHTYGLPVILTHSSNNFGPNQNVEKLIPKVINSFMNKIRVPIYGNGKNIRDWIYVEDHVDALITISKSAKPNDRILIGADNPLSNIELINKIFKIYKKLFNTNFNLEFDQVIKFVDDRKGHDFCYKINNSKLINNFNWYPKYNFEKGIENTINWYVNQNI